MRYQDLATLDDYLGQYGTVIGGQTAHQMEPLHVPGKTPLMDFSGLTRSLLPAQAHTVTAMVRQLGRDRSVVLVGQMGVGKTICSIATIHAKAAGRPYNAVVFCPPHLVNKWQREIEDTLGDVTVVQVGSYRQLVSSGRLERSGATWYIMSETTAKLGAPWKGAYHNREMHRRGNHTVRITRDGEASLCHCVTCGEPLMHKTATGEQVLLEEKDLNQRFRNCLNCDDEAYTYISKFDRWPVGKLIHKKLKGWLDFLIVDEAHQAKGADTAIGNAVGCLAQASKYVIAMTGTIIGGYAEHLRTLLFRVAPTTLVDEGLGWRDLTAFNERYGRIERKVIEKQTWKRNTWTTGSKKTTKAVRPGVMPQLFGRHLLDKCVFLSLDEIASNLPPLIETVCPIEMDPETAQEYERVEERLVTEYKAMAARKDNRLLGAMIATTIGYADMPWGWGDIGYYEGQGDDREFVNVVTPANLTGRTIRPKEQALIDLVLKEKSEGRQCWVFTTMTGKRDAAERLAVLLQSAGLRSSVLRSSVEPKEREAWIAQYGRQCDVIVSHPQLVETGLDLFDKKGGHNFVTLIYYQTGYNLFTLRQSSRRSWRIGQTRECRVFYLFYQNTMQDRAMTLMGRKLTAAMSLDGKFSSEGLVAMAGEDSSIEMEMAKSLANRLSDCATTRTWERIGDKPKPQDAPGIAPTPQQVIPAEPPKEREPEPAGAVIRALPLGSRVRNRAGQMQLF